MVKDTTNDLITVIIPVYNAAQFIEKTLDSLYLQTYQNFQIIIIDDGSTDNGIDICKKYAEDKGKLEIFQQENRGPASARNIGIENAKGQFIYFIDGDDFVDKNALEVLVNCYKESKAEWVLTEYYDISDDNRTTPRNFWSQGDSIEENDDFFHISQNQFIDRIVKNHQTLTGINCWGNLYLTEIIKEKNIKFDDNARRSEDFVFCLKYISHIKTVAIPKELCFYYRQHTTHISTKEVSIPFANYISDIKLIELPFRELLKINSSVDNKTVEQTISGYIFNLIFPWVVKQCKDENLLQYKVIKKELGKLVADQFIQKRLKYYKPTKNQSKLLPFWIKIKAVRLLIMTSTKIAQKRYKKIKLKDITA